ncbi:MAG: TIGR02757 family protein [Deltaproteobacteria bacterium]|nr:TIGR02757 family protein [Deltaproteobacteria bacterium]
MKRRLDQLVASTDHAARREADPVGFVHRYADPADKEVVGLVAAGLAFGNVVAIRRSVQRVLDTLGPSPAAAVDERTPARLRRDLKGFVHRVWKGEHVAAMLANAGAIRRSHGSLGQRFTDHVETSGDLREGLARFADELRGPNADRSLRHLVPDPRAGSACKRLLLYVRWMVRPADGVDLGLWPLDPSHLVIPVDTHIHRIGKNLGLTDRNDASWRTAEEITDALRVIDRSDPVRYDFALCHMGVSRDCPSRRDPVKCKPCVLRPVCRAYRAG